MTAQTRSNGSAKPLKSFNAQALLKRSNGFPKSLIPLLPRCSLSRPIYYVYIRHPWCGWRIRGAVPALGVSIPTRAGACDRCGGKFSRVRIEFSDTIKSHPADLAQPCGEAVLPRRPGALPRPFTPDRWGPKAPGAVSIPNAALPFRTGLGSFADFLSAYEFQGAYLRSAHQAFSLWNQSVVGKYAPLKIKGIQTADAHRGFPRQISALGQGSHPWKIGTGAYFAAWCVLGVPMMEPRGRRAP